MVFYIHQTKSRVPILKVHRVGSHLCGKFKETPQDFTFQNISILSWAKYNQMKLSKKWWKKDIKHRAWPMKGMSGNLEGALGSQGVELAPLGTWSEQVKEK